MKLKHATILSVLFCSLQAAVLAQTAGGPFIWKCAAWWGPTGSVQAAKDMGFNAVVAGFSGDRLKDIIEEGRRCGVEIYLDAEFLGDEQVQTEAELKALEQKNAQTPKGDVATWIPGKRGDTMGLNYVCFSRPERIATGRKKVEDLVGKFNPPGLCIDAIGYRNQYGCHCPQCKTARDEYAKQHPELKGTALDDAFFEWALVNFVTELAKTARAIKPDIKLSVYAEPTFAPNPTFGANFPVDYWMTCVSYYSKPHWDDATIRRMCKEAVSAKGKAKPVPYIGDCDGGSAKTPEQLAKEIAIVRESGATAIAIFELSHLIQTPEVKEAVRKGLCGDGKKE